MNSKQDNIKSDAADKDEEDLMKEKAAQDKNRSGDAGNSSDTGKDEKACDKADSKAAGSKPDRSEEAGGNTGCGETSGSVTGHEDGKDSEAAEDTAFNGGQDEGSDNKKQESPKKDSKDVLIEELQDKCIRQMAEFDNFRKRSEKEKSAMYEIGARDIIEKILPIVDNFERGLESVSEEEKATPFAEGIDKIYKQLTKALEDMGVKPIEALGKEFNPDFHNAVMHVDDEEAGESIIVEEFQKGYTYRDSVVRHSMVKVAN